LGSAYGFDWAKHNPDRVRALLHGGHRATLQKLGRNERNHSCFPGFRSPEGEKMILDENTFVEGILFGTIPKLSEAEYAEYRRPFSA